MSSYYSSANNANGKREPELEQFYPSRLQDSVVDS
jgi:hypothetical protein